MNVARTLIASIVFLGLGLGLIVGHSHDSTISFSAAHPASAASLQIIIHTEGLPAMAGVAASFLGVLLLFTAMVLAVLHEVGSSQIARDEKSPVAHA